MYKVRVLVKAERKAPMPEQEMRVRKNEKESYQVILTRAEGGRWGKGHARSKLQRIDCGGRKRSSLVEVLILEVLEKFAIKLGRERRVQKSANEKVKKGKQRSRIEWPGMTILTGQHRETNYVEGS